MEILYDFDTTPYNESCEQLGKNYNPSLARFEAQQLISQLVTTFGEPPESSKSPTWKNSSYFYVM